MADQPQNQNVESMEGTLEVAVAWPETPVSVNFYAVDKDGFNYQWTLRDFDEMRLARRVSEFKHWLLDHGVLPKPVGQQPQQSQPAAPQPPVSGTTNGTHTPPPATGNKSAGQEQSFAADSLIGSILEGKLYWKVKGGRFSKYGVSIWPEVLKAAGYDVDALDPRQVYGLNGFTAYYATDENGKATKVTRLERE